MRDERWDVVVLDINLPGATGSSSSREIQRDQPGSPVLILTVYSEEQYAVRAVRAGRRRIPDEGERAGEAHRRGEQGRGRRTLRHRRAGRAARVASSPAKHHGAPHERLSNREFEIFKIIASGKTVGEIARELSLSVKTVSTHRTRILAKMEMKTNAELTHYAVKNGLVE